MIHEMFLSSAALLLHTGDIQSDVHIFARFIAMPSFCSFDNDVKSPAKFIAILIQQLSTQAEVVLKLWKLVFLSFFKKKQLLTESEMWSLLTKQSLQSVFPTSSLGTCMSILLLKYVVSFLHFSFYIYYCWV